MPHAAPPRQPRRPSRLSRRAVERSYVVTGITYSKFSGCVTNSVTVTHSKGVDPGQNIQLPFCAGFASWRGHEIALL